MRNGLRLLRQDQLAECGETQSVDRAFVLDLGFAAIGQQHAAGPALRRGARGSRTLVAMRAIDLRRSRQRRDMRSHEPILDTNDSHFQINVESEASALELNEMLMR